MPGQRRRGTDTATSLKRGNKKQSKTGNPATLNKGDFAPKQEKTSASKARASVRTQRPKKQNFETSAPSLISVPRRRSVVTQEPATPADLQGPDKKDTTFVSTEETAADTEQLDDPRIDEESETGAADDVGMLGIGSPLFPPSAHLDLEDQFEETSSPNDAWDDTTSVEARIRELQERLDGLMSSTLPDDLDQGPAPGVETLTPDSGESAVDSAREVLQSEYFRKNWGRSAIRQQTFEVDDFGLDPDFEERVRPAVEFLFKRYFRVEVDGIRNIPETGRGVIVANHSGALPWDGVMLREAIRTRHKTRNDLRWLAEDFSFYLPFLGVFINRMGAVRACPENAQRLLEREHLVGVFPEGAEGTKKLFRNRYRLQRFGRGGFVRLCLQTKSPIIPCAIVGAEETNPIVYRFDNLSKVLGLEYLPVTPTFPALGPLGLVPAPTKWRIIFGEPISVDEYGPQAASDHVLVGRLAEQVRTNISNMLETALRRRKSVWLG